MTRIPRSRSRRRAQSSMSFSRSCRARTSCATALWSLPLPLSPLPHFKDGELDVLQALWQLQTMMVTGDCKSELKCSRSGSQ